MLQAVKRQFRVQWRNWTVNYILAVILGIAGVMLFFIIMMLDREGNKYFTPGTLSGCMCVTMICILSGIILMKESFNLEVSMGCTRSRFFVSFYVVSLMGVLLCVPLLLLIYLAEKMLYSSVFPDFVSTVDLFPYILKIGSLAAVVIPMISVLGGALLLRFGRKAFWGIWAVWMTGSLGIPHILDLAKETPDSAWGGFISILHMVSGNAWFLIAGLTGLTSIAVAYLIIRKQQVSL